VREPCCDGGGDVLEGEREVVRTGCQAEAREIRGQKVVIR